MQFLSNLQDEANECYADSLNVYFDTFSALASKYAHCKNKCLAKNPELVLELKQVDAEREAGSSARYFDPQNSDPCLSECRAQFYFIFRKTNEYYVKEKGLYIEQADVINKLFSQT